VQGDEEGGSEEGAKGELEGCVVEGRGRRSLVETRKEKNGRANRLQCFHAENSVLKKKRGVYERVEGEG